MKKFIVTLLIGLFVVQFNAFSQSNRWKRTRYELVGGIGATSFMGDLGGGDNASHFISDFNFSAQRPLLHAGFRYKILEPLAVKTAISYGWVSGDDKKSDNIYRLDRNLSFRSPIVEFASQLEYSIIKEPASHRYSLRRGKRFSLKTITVNTYLFAGIAGFWFNPRGLDDGPGGTNKWVSLQPLGTEGQGLMEGREKYSRLALALPFGIGFKYSLNRVISVGVEFGARYTFTDYIDDVSTTYVDNTWLASENPLAARMTDKSTYTENPLPSKELIPYEPGGQRGSSQYNDFYMFSLVTVSYKLRTGRNGLPKF
ncbi:MAG: hypothetical protein JEZ09_03815 [Salinivirgaceae bacterium]|nr:hypothetical protein [Salinivirgaceae bacterium]